MFLHVFFPICVTGYDSSCINLIQEHTNYTNDINDTNSPLPLSATMNQSSMNTTIAELINNLFVEQWVTTMNYSLYYEQCAPLLCSYTYIQQFNLIYIVTLLIGLQGGLTIVLKWICPKIVRIIVKVYQYQKKRMNSVQHSSSLEMMSVNTNVRQSTGDVEAIPTIVTSQYAFFIFI